MVSRVLSRMMPIVGWVTFAATFVWVTVGAIVYSDQQYFPGDAVTVLAFTAVGALVVSRQPLNLAGILCLTPAFIAAEYALGAYVSMAERHGIPGTVWVGWATRWIWAVGVLLPMTLLPLVLPDGKLPHRRWRPVAWLIGTVTSGLIVLIALVPAQPGTPPNPVGIPAMEWLPESNGVIWSIMGGCAVAALASLMHRLVLSKGRERSQMLWIALGAWLFVLGKLVEAGSGEPLEIIAGIGSILAFPVACGVAILRYDLLSLDRMLRTSLLYVLLATLLATIYLGLRELVGADPLVGTGTAVGLALVTPALHRWLNGGVSRLMYGKRGSPGEVLAELGRRLVSAAGPDAVLAALAESVARALPVDVVHVVLMSADHELRRITRGAVDTPVRTTIPLRFQGIELGRIDTAPTGTELDKADQTLLADLAGTAAAAVAAAHRAEELQRAREQLVITRERERRRIARDLHDELGPVLSGLGFTLDALRASVRGTDHIGIVTQARGDVREAVQLVRRVARQLRPAFLDHLGLVESLRELAARHTCPSLAVTFTTDELGELTAATEVAAYAIVAEALTNVGRHAAARHCAISLTRTDNELTVTVEDDGVGLDSTPAGLGRTSMTERAEELGGWCRVSTNKNRGTTVQACLPTGIAPADSPPRTPIESGS